LDSPQSVLIVDRSEETREVLRTALERRGVRTFTTGRGRQGLELARQYHPDLIVLDIEAESADRKDFAGALVQQSQQDHTRLVVLGSIRRPRPGLAGEEFVAKPYHYGPLIRKIGELLGAPRQPLARSA
jgi:CheY-like chemotaxis protein